MSDVIDLRNQRNIHTDTDESTLDSHGGETPHDARGVSDAREIVSWSALEYETRQYSHKWFIGMGTAAVLFIVVGILAKSYFFVALIAIAFVVVVLYTRRLPHIVRFAITDKGIQAGNAMHEFSRLKSFWVFATSERRELSLETDKLLMPYVHIPIGECDPDELETILSIHLEKKEHEDSVADHIARVVGF